MSTHNIKFHDELRNNISTIPKYLFLIIYHKNFIGTKNEFESATVNEPLTFEFRRFTI